MAFFLFTIFSSFFLVSICCLVINKFGSDGAFVILAASLMIIALTISLGFYALLSRTQFTYQGGIITAIISIVVVFSLIFWVNIKMVVFVLISIIGVVLYGLFLVYDIQSIITGEVFRMDPDI